MDTGPSSVFLTNILKYRLDRQLNKLRKNDFIDFFHVINCCTPPPTYSVLAVNALTFVWHSMMGREGQG